MPERNRGYLRKQRLRNIERRKKLISQHHMSVMKPGMVIRQVILVR